MSAPIGRLEGLPLSEEEWKRHRMDAVASLPAAYSDKDLPDILMPFQKELLASTAQFNLTVANKSRRTGATWGVGADAVLTSGASKSAGGMDTLYLGYNLDMAREFIDTCAMWARAFQPAASQVEEYLFADGKDAKGADRSIQAFRIRFASGYEIVALSSKPRSLRGRQGYVILDEFAFHDDAEELLKAAFALLIWGGKVLVISTHSGFENPFNKLIEDINAGRVPGNVVRCTFDEAVDQGLFQRVCLSTGKEWSVDAEAAWRAEIRQIYRANAGEELDCIPNQGTGVYIPRVLIEACTNPALLPVLRLDCPADFVMRSEEYRMGVVQEFLDNEVAPRLALLDKKCSHAFGQDFGRDGDLSVMTVEATLANLMRSIPLVIELRRVPFEQQKQIALFVIERLPRRGGIKLDAGGNGQYLAEVVMQKFGAEAVECVKLSQAWYIENMPKLKAVFEDRYIEIGADTFLVSDLALIRLINGVPKVPDNAKADDRDGGKRHGDFAVSLALAHIASYAAAISYDGYQGAVRDASPFGRDDDDRRWRNRPDEQLSSASRFNSGGTW